MGKTNIIAAGGLVQNKEQALLFIYRRGFWDLPKGKLDAGESIEACALREVQEEVGIQNLTIQSKINTTEHIYFDPYLQEEVIKTTHWYLMYTDDNSPLIPQAEENIEKAVWVKPDQLEIYLSNTYANIIEVIKAAGF